jgi:hypothetical protein
MEIILAILFGLLFVSLVSMGKDWLKLQVNHIYFAPCHLVLCVYNCEKYIEGFMRYIIGWQREIGLPHKLIVIDYNSKDHTYDILKKINYPYPKYEIYKQNEVYIQEYGIYYLYFHLKEEDDLQEQFKRFRQCIWEYVQKETGNQLVSWPPK